MSVRLKSEVDDRSKRNATLKCWRIFFFSELSRFPDILIYLKETISAYPDCVGT